MSVTIGIPMQFYDDDGDTAIRDEFLTLIQAAVLLRRECGALPAVEEVSRIRALVPAAIALAHGKERLTEERKLRDWIRSEAEAAILLSYQSPDVLGGQFACVDVGAGTTNASMFRITTSVKSGREIQDKVAFFSALSRPQGMDYLHEKCRRAAGDEVPYDERKSPSSSSNSNVLRAARDAADDIRSNLYGAAMSLACRKCGNSVFEKQRWTDEHRLFVIGGGANESIVQSELEFGPPRPLATSSELTRVPKVPQKVPDDLTFHNDSRPNLEALRFLYVAYGLSHRGRAVPEARSPSDIDPLPELDVQAMPDHEILYAR
jgi:hypothetical protein